MGYQDNPIREVFADSDRITCIADVDLTGKRFVTIVPGGTDAQAPRVTTATAGSRPFGVTQCDKKAGEPITIYRRGIVTVTTSAAITGNAGVAVGANGTAVTVAAAPAVEYGVALANTANGADAAVALSL